MRYADTQTIAEVHAVPQVAIPDVTTSVILSVLVLDDTDQPVSGASVTWTGTLDSNVYTATTDDTGMATCEVTLADLPKDKCVYPYIAYLDSDISTGKNVNVRVANPIIPLCQVNDGGDFEIDDYDIANGVTVTIPAYPNALRGDRVNFYWDEIHTAGLSVTDPDTDFPWVINVNNSLPPECLVSGEYNLYYQFVDSNNNYGVSLPRKESVTGGQPAPTLPGPDFPEADINGGWINGTQALDGTPALLKWNDIKIGDEVALSWTMYDANHVQVKYDGSLAGTVAQTEYDQGYLIITIPAGDILQGVQLGSAEAWYTVTSASDGTVRTSVTTTVGVDTQA